MPSVAHVEGSGTAYMQTESSPTQLLVLRLVPFKNATFVVALFAVKRW